MDEAKAAFAAFQRAQAEIQAKCRARLQRTYEMMQEIDPVIASQVFGVVLKEERKEDARTKAAVQIQKMYRGWRGRRRYRDLLLDMYEREEEEEREKERRRMEEGMLLLDTLQLEQSLKDQQFLHKQHTLERIHAATLIQRAYRRHKRWAPPMPVLTVLEKEEEVDIKLDIEEEIEENEVFRKQHWVSRDEEYSPAPRLSTKSRFLIPSDMDQTSCSFLRETDIPPNEDFSFSQPPAKLPVPPISTKSTLPVPYLARLQADYRLQTYSNLLNTLNSLGCKAAELSEELVLVLEEREVLREKVEFSNKIIRFLSNLK